MMPKVKTTIADLFNVPGRFLRSAQLEKDFHDARALENYIITPPMADAFVRITDGLRKGATRRAWRITGDYGVGKSSFALALAHLLYNSDQLDVRRIADAMGWPNTGSENCSLFPVLVTGGREGIISALLRGISEAVRRIDKDRKSNPWRNTIDAVSACERHQSVETLEKLIAVLRADAIATGKGILLIIDELGKLLEYAALNPDKEDVFVLQRLAETAARSDETPFVMLGMLHQGFQAYAERLPANVRHEWDKVAGRFEEIVFDQPLVHTAALVAGALGIEQASLPKHVASAAAVAAKATSSMGWLGGATTSASTLDAKQLYPVHPTLLPPLVRFFARFGQSERSLFGFLLSSEPFGLQAFAQTTAPGGAWYDIADFYDYVRANFGHRLAGGSYQSHWVRIVATIDSTHDISPLEQRLLKASGILNLLDADDLVPNDRTLKACFSAEDQAAIDRSLSNLLERGLLFRRGERGGFRLWPNSSVNVHAAVQNARRSIGSLEAVSLQLAQLLTPYFVMARRHYIERGTMRYFEVRYVFADNLRTACAVPTDADGLVLLALGDTGDDLISASAAAQELWATSNKTLVIGALQPVWTLSPDLLEVKVWQWVKENTPELGHDNFAAAEVSRQLNQAAQSLSHHFQVISGLGRDAGASVTWFNQGQKLDIGNGLSDALSRLCDDVFPHGPKISNELLNRNTLSSAAASARMRLVEGMFNSSDKALLGINADKAPPEKSMYLSVLRKGLIHVEGSSGHVLQMPDKDNDPLNLRPAMEHTVQVIRQGKGRKVKVSAVLDELKQTPYGIRDGVAPLVLALILKIFGHELAVYENGTFLTQFGALEFQRLTKAAGTFEIQFCSVEGVRSSVFVRLAELFANQVVDRQPVLLDVVQSLCQFAAKLPDYSRKARCLSTIALAVRDALLSAKEPATLLFVDLPKACELPAFDIDNTATYSEAEQFVSHLNNAIAELQAAYPKLLERIIVQVAEAIGQEGHAFDRAGIAARAARVSLAAREPRMRAFAQRLRDPGLSDDAWAEALASFVVARPPNRWQPGDEVRFNEEIGALAEIFAKMEAAAFSGAELKPAFDAVRLNMTRGDGVDLVKVLHPVTLDANDQVILEQLIERLPQGDTKRIQFLTNMLWAELEKGQKRGEPGREAGLPQQGSTRQ